METKPLFVEDASNEKLAQKTSKKPEHIGHMLVNAPETVERIFNNVVKPESVAKPAGGKMIENLSRDELLSLSDKIIIEGTSLRQIYETHLLGERGLRRMVAEHVRGGDMNKALRREIVEREIDFERDPAIRDFVPTEAVQAANGGKSAEALDELLKAANIDVNTGGEEIAFFRARSRYEASQLHKHKQQRQLMNIGFAVSTGILILIILILFLTRG